MLGNLLHNGEDGDRRRTITASVDEKHSFDVPEMAGIAAILPAYC